MVLNTLTGKILSYLSVFKYWTLGHDGCSHPTRKYMSPVATQGKKGNHFSNTVTDEVLKMTAWHARHNHQPKFKSDKQSGGGPLQQT